MVFSVSFLFAFLTHCYLSPDKNQSCIKRERRIADFRLSDPLYLSKVSPREGTLIYRESLCRAYAESCFGTVTSFVSSSFSLGNRESWERPWWSAWRSLPVNQDSPSFYLPARVLFTRVNVPIILPFLAAHILHLEKCDKFAVLSWYFVNTVLKSIYIILFFYQAIIIQRIK